MEQNIQPTVEPVSISISQPPPKVDINGKPIRFKNYNALRTQHKINQQKDLFINHLELILKEYNPIDNQLDEKILIEVLNIANEYFYIGNKDDRDKAKFEAVKKLMLPYFMCNELVLEKSIVNVYHKVKKSNFIKRYLKRLSHFLKKKN